MGMPLLDVPPGAWLLAKTPDNRTVRITAASWRSVYQWRGYELIEPDPPKTSTTTTPHILAHVHQAAGRHNAGAEWYLHTVLKAMRHQGAEVRVIVRDGFDEPLFDGIEYLETNRVAEHYRWADVVITHLDLTAKAATNAQRYSRPLVHIVHNDQQLTFHKVRPSDAALVVFNSHWVAQEVQWAGRSLVIPPPVIAADYRVERDGHAITLVNCSRPKGADTFFAAAQAMPDRPFIAVAGSYGRQAAEELSNVTYIPNTSDIREVYRQTRILLMPSDYESWGRVGIEAAASGIPTIAHPTPGLRESLGKAGIFRDRDRPDQWIRMIRALDDPGLYERASAAALKRSASLDPALDLERLRAALWELAGADEQSVSLA